MTDGFVIGRIHPVSSDSDKPEFEIIRRDAFREPEKDVRACAHGKFILDEQWATVTCGLCREKVDPFAALMYYALNYEATRREHQRLIEQEKSTRIAELKRLGRLRDASEENRAEIARLTGWGFGGTVGELREAERRISREINDRRYAKREARRRGSAGGSVRRAR